MPGLDSTGPMGQGARTGRKLGNCSGNTSEQDRPQGRGFGFGFRARFIDEDQTGFGRGMRGGRGRGRRFNAKPGRQGGQQK